MASAPGDAFAEPHQNVAVPSEVAARSGDVFPLRLTPFEAFLLADDSPSYPMVFYVELVFRGAIDRAAFENAVRTAATRHPLLLARLSSLGGKLHWLRGSGHDLPIHWQSDASPAPSLPPRIDLNSECGLRVRVHVGATTSVMLQIHHACCDGQGARRLIVDMLTAYTLQIDCPERAPRWDDMNTRGLADRGAFDRSSQAVAPLGAWQQIKNAVSFLALRPAPLAASRSALETSARRAGHSPLLLNISFSPEETSRFQRLLAGGTETLNDAAVANLFRTLAAWNVRHGGAKPRQRLRVLMPANMRKNDDRELPAANRLGFCFLTREVRDCDNREALLRGITQETRFNRTANLGLDFIEGLGALQLVPGALKAAVGLSGCMTTAVLTNLGDPSRKFLRRFPSRDGFPLIGNLTLERVFGVPPIRARTRLGIGLCTFAGSLSMSLQFDPTHFSVSSAGEFCDAYVAAWRDWAHNLKR